MAQKKLYMYAVVCEPRLWIEDESGEAHLSKGDRRRIFCEARNAERAESAVKQHLLAEDPGYRLYDRLKAARWNRAVPENATLINAMGCP